MKDLKEKFNFILPEGTTEVVFREGAAVEVINPEIHLHVKTNLAGTLGSVAEFLDKRRSEIDQVDQKHCHVIVNREELTIKLVINANDSLLKGSVIGILKRDPALAKFRINSEEVWEPNKLGQFFKMNRAFFCSLEDNMALVTKLKNYEATIDANVKKFRSESGSTTDNYSQEVNSNLPPNFQLKISIFKGSPAEIIEVEFDSYVTGRDIRLKLISPAASQMIEDTINTAIDVEIANIRNLTPDIVIIEE